jgi:hypothetical protein
MIRPEVEVKLQDTFLVICVVLVIFISSGLIAVILTQEIGYKFKIRSGNP